MNRLLTNGPMTARRLVKITSAIIGTGRAKLSATWL
jgi:hypothetical protein